MTQQSLEAGMPALIFHRLGSFTVFTARIIEFRAAAHCVEL